MDGRATIETDPGVRRFLRCCAGAAVALLAALVVLHLILLPTNDGAPLTPDSAEYQQLAVNLLRAGTYSLDRTPPLSPTLWRTPGYPLLVAGLYGLGGETWRLVPLFQLGCLAVVSWVTYRLGTRLIGPREGALAGLLSLGYLTAVTESIVPLTEPVASLGAAVAVWLLVRLLEPGAAHRPLLSFGLGAWIGAVALVRPNLLLLLLLAGVLLALQPFREGWRAKVASLALLCAGFTLVLAPWLVRNARLCGRPVMSSGSGISLYASALQHSGRVSPVVRQDEWTTIIDAYNAARATASERIAADPALQHSSTPVSVQGELIADALLTREARDLLRATPPGTILRHLPGRLAYLWSTADASSRFPPPIAGRLHLLAQVQHVLLFALAGLGIVLCRRRLLRLWPLWSVALYLTAVHCVYHEEPRYSVPGRAPLLVFAAVPLVRLGTRLARSRQ